MKIAVACLLLVIMLLGGAFAGPKTKAKVSSFRNPPTTVLISEPQEGEIWAPGPGKGAIKFRNRIQFPITVFVMVPGETTWRRVQFTVDGESSTTLTGLAPGIYRLAAERNLILAPGYEEPSFWEYGPVEIRVKKGSRWTLR